MKSFAPLKKIAKIEKVRKIKKKRYPKPSTRYESIELYDWYITTNTEAFIELDE